mmetsp:Transcript_18069/g.36777  ORF Transcript_18069/g.36777 Transcript_18069/m.36777 type:complete len:415 (-) Transcript_18069:384-1628(-)
MQVLVRISRALEEVAGLADRVEQIPCQHRAQVGLNDHAKHGDVGARVREEWHLLFGQWMVEVHVVASHVPVALRQDVLQVDRVVRKPEILIELRGDDREAPLVAGVEDGEERLARRHVHHLTQPLADTGRDRHLGLAQRGVAVASEPQELEQLHSRPRGRPREVESVRVCRPTQVGDRDRDVLREIVAVAPHHPACATHRLAKLVAGRRHGEYRRHSEVAQPHVSLRLEGHDETAARRIDMDAHLPSVLAVEILEHLPDFRHRVVVTAVVVPEDADHADSLLVDGSPHVLGAHGHFAHARKDEVGLDVHVLEELLPRRLVHCRDHEVGILASDCVLAESMPGGIPLAPAKFERQPRQETGLGGAHGTRSGMTSILVERGALGNVPQVSEHVQGVVVKLETTWVDGLVGNVDFEA